VTRNATIYFYVLSICHHLEQGSSKQKWQTLSVNPRPPTRGRGKGGKGRETYKLEIKTTLLIILREIIQNITNQYWVSWNCMTWGLAWRLALRMRLPGRHQAVPDRTLQ